MCRVIFHLHTYVADRASQDCVAVTNARKYQPVLAAIHPRLCAANGRTGSRAGGGYSRNKLDGRCCKLGECRGDISNASSSSGGGGDASSVATITPVVPQPVSAPTASLVVTPSSIISGQNATLTWSSTNATVCTGTNFVTNNNLTVSMVVAPSTTTIYSISCISAASSSTNATASARVSGASSNSIAAQRCISARPKRPDDVAR